MVTTTKTVALITGANKGIGLAAAKALGLQGITVLVGARDAQRGEEAAAELRKHNIDAHAITIDVASGASIDAAAKQVGEQFGKLDILINNAGVNFDGEDFSRPVVSAVDPKNLRATFETNVFGLIETTQAFLPLIKKSAAGRIVNVGSILGSLTLHADPKSPIYGSKLFAYNASKTAVNAFTVHLAYELKDTNIRVNTAHPGWVQTDLGGKNAPLTTDQGAETLVQLATLDANGPTGGYFHNGQSLPW